MRSCWAWLPDPDPLDGAGVPVVLLRGGVEPPPSVPRMCPIFWVSPVPGFEVEPPPLLGVDAVVDVGPFAAAVVLLDEVGALVDLSLPS